MANFELTRLRRESLKLGVPLWWKNERRKLEIAIGQLSPDIIVRKNCLKRERDLKFCLFLCRGRVRVPLTSGIRWRCITIFPITANEIELPLNDQPILSVKTSVWLFFQGAELGKVSKEDEKGTFPASPRQ
ncbi:hypothetical protein J6590_055683 [Homalodisca vitripennis]|nr:hypothetical protein J6590_055683 [Homalodisca vitripennis]